jgi:hypothetical protein
MTAAAAAELTAAIEASQEAVQQQGDVVRSLKASLKDGKAQQVCGEPSCSARHTRREHQAGGCSSWQHRRLAGRASRAAAAWRCARVQLLCRAQHGAHARCAARPQPLLQCWGVAAAKGGTPGCVGLLPRTSTTHPRACVSCSRTWMPRSRSCRS